ncbi:MAG: DUF935 family protein [Capnocytophaga sp.]|nr:DUF935 family protein [Capnocytophaga sp.]
MAEIGFKKKNKAVKISQTLVVRPPQRTPQDISRWRSAIQQADRGRIHTLVELYNDLLIDAVLSSAVEKRIMAVTNATLLFSANNKEVEAMADLIETPEFEEFLREVMLSKFYPKTVLELDFQDGFKVVSIDRRHLDLENKIIAKSVGDTQGISYENDDFLIHLGKEGDLGLFVKTAPHAIMKRNGTGDFARYAELFGIDTLVGYYDPEDESGRSEMESAFQKRGGSASMTMSKNSEVKTIGTQSPGTVDIHERFLRLCDEQMLIGVLGQTMTTKDGSSYSQGKVHADTEDDINKADRRFVQRILNKELLPRLEKRGYPVKGGWFHFAEKSERLSKIDELAIAKGVNEIVPIDENHWYENFGLPKPTKAGNPTEKKEKNDTADAVTEDKKLSVSRLGFFDRLKDFFGNAPH